MTNAEKQQLKEELIREFVQAMAELNIPVNYVNGDNTELRIFRAGYNTAVKRANNRIVEAYTL